LYRIARNYSIEHLGGEYLYYIFLDGDAELWSPPQLNNFRYYEKLLLINEPAIGGPQNMFGPITRVQDWQKSDPPFFNQVAKNFNMDAIIIGIHFEAAQSILPWVSTFDSESWWYSQLIFLHHAVLLFPYNSYFMTGVAFRNGGHLSYPRGKRFEYITNVTNDNLPSHLRNCISWKQREKVTPGITKPKFTNYKTHTMYNVPSCKNYRIDF